MHDIEYSAGNHHHKLVFTVPHHDQHTTTKGHIPS